MSILVMAYRYGNVNSYHFPIGIFDSVTEAEKAAREHHVFRGGKYDHIGWECEKGVEYDAEEAKVVFNTCQTKEEQGGIEEG